MRRVCVFLGIGWLLATGGLYVLMLQRPERLKSLFDSTTPRVVKMILPFRTLWLFAREGNLRVGDEAPDFTLPMVHSEHAMKVLSQEFERRPVVLVFGSYT